MERDLNAQIFIIHFVYIRPHFCLGNGGSQVFPYPATDPWAPAFQTVPFPSLLTGEEPRAFCLFVLTQHIFLKVSFQSQNVGTKSSPSLRQQPEKGSKQGQEKLATPVTLISKPFREQQDISLLIWLFPGSNAAFLCRSTALPSRHWYQVVPSELANWRFWLAEPKFLVFMVTDVESVLIRLRRGLEKKGSPISAWNIEERSGLSFVCTAWF